MQPIQRDNFTPTPIAMTNNKMSLMKNSTVQNKPHSKKSRMAKSAPSPTSAERHKVLHNYHDHAQVTLPSQIEVDTKDSYDKRKGPRGGVTVPFPTKLHVMLSKVEESGLSHVVSWQPHGRCFVVHKPKVFVAEVMPAYFRQSKLTSFQRQLNLYGFNRITTGKDRGGYYHEFFLRHKLFLCQKMTRIRIKGTGIKGRASPETEPDFYSMPMVNPEDSSKDLNRDLEGEVAAAIEEENKLSEPTRKPSRKRQDGGNKKKRAASRKSPKIEPFETDSGYSSPKITSMSIAASTVVTPNTMGTKKPPCVPSSLDMSLNTAGPIKFHRQLSLSVSRTRDQQKLMDLFPPLVLSDSADTEIEEPQSGDEVTFEGKHFHYLDSFTAPPTPSRVFSLDPRRSGSMPQHSQNNVAPSSFPHLVHSLPEIPLSIARSLREPILTPSSSSSSLAEMFQQDDSLEINPDTIFSENGFDNGDWAVGEDVDIDAEFTMLGR